MNTPDPVIIPIDGEPSDARAYVAIYGDYITEKEFNDAMDRYFEAVSKDVTSEVKDSFLDKKLHIAKSMDEYIGGAILG